jgi:tetratricopeptide (TPR) repeat protein
MSAAMHRLWPLLLAAACSSMPRSDYVPGGKGLPEEARSIYASALAAEREGDTETALKLLDDLCARHPIRLGFHLRRIQIAREARGVAFASRLYDPPPPGVDPERAGVLATLAALDEEDLSGRRNVLVFAAEREPKEAFWRLGLADVDLAAHDHIVERAHRERDLGMVQASAKSFAAARDVLERAREEAGEALELLPEFAEAHLLLGYMATRSADLAEDIDSRDQWREKAEEHYLEAVRIDPGSVAARLDLAENYLYFDRYSEAADHLRDASVLAPSEPMVWNNLGFTYYATGRLSSAVSCYEKALEIEPKNARSRTALSDCLRRLDKVSEAVAQLTRAREDAGDDRSLEAEIALKLGAIYEHESRYREAVQEYRRHVDLGGKDAAKARSRIRHIYETAFEK